MSRSSKHLAAGPRAAPSHDEFVNPSKSALSFMSAASLDECICESGDMRRLAITIGSASWALLVASELQPAMDESWLAAFASLGSVKEHVIFRSSYQVAVAEDRPFEMLGSFL